MIEMMSANIVYTEQKKRNTQGCDITKYFSPSTKVNSIPSQSSPVGPEEIPDYFKRNCAPLDLSQPTVFPRSSIHNEGSDTTQMDVANKWANVKDVSRCDALAYKDDVGMERFERQIFQELDSRMCHELDSKVADEDEISGEQRMYDAGLSMKYEREIRNMADPQNNLLSLAEQQQQQQLMSEKGTPTITNAFNVMMTNNRSLNTQEICSAVSKETPSCANYLYAEPQNYKWVSDLPSSLVDMKDNVNESKIGSRSSEGATFEGGQSTIDVLPPSCIKEMPVDSLNVNPDASMFPAAMTSDEMRQQRLQQPQQRNANAARNDDAVQVISYEDFLKSEGISVPSKDKSEQDVAATEPTTKKQSNIRRFFTRVPRTVEVKFDHKRLVTVTAVVHPQPQSPRKLPAKKTTYKRQSPRRPVALRSGGVKNNSDAKHTSYNTRQRKSNVVVDNEEIDLSIEEMGLEKTVDKPARKRLQRPKLQERNDNLSKKTIYSGSCNNVTNQNGNDDRWILRPRLESATGGRKSARLNPQLENNNEIVNSEADDSALRSHKPLRSIYKSTVVQRDSSGLRLKLTRIGRKHHHRHHHQGHRHKKHKSAKMQRAMQLLQKAKDSSVPRDLHNADSGVRRSPRQSSVIVRKAMEGAARAEELRQARITAQRLVPKKRLRVRRRLRMMNKKSELTLRSQTAAKLSPSESTAPTAAKKFTNLTDGGIANKKPEIGSTDGKEQLKGKESSTLSSDVTRTTESKTSAFVFHGQEDFSLLKPLTHVQQRVKDNFFWNLAPATLNYRTNAPEDDSNVKIATNENIQLGILSSISGKVSECYKSQVDKLSSYSVISKRLPSSLVTQILKDVASRFPNFSAFKLYRRYKLKHRKALNSEEAFQSRSADNKKRPSNTTACAVIKKHRAANEDVVAEEKENAEETVSEPKSIKTSQWQWTDKYQPSHSADVIGNGRVMRHMKQWLVDWREKCKLEAKQKRVKSEKKEKTKGSWEDDDSDFILSDGNDDSNLDDYRLCNTMLLSGPSGTGKTAAIYALAEELGYKVFEINATSKRVGKQVLIQLQEATQSHQVIARPKPIKAFFESKKEESQPSMKTETKAARKEYSEDVPAVPTTISLVLFEDVDLVFEEDEGFVQAVNTFMATTKRPIILTTSNATFDSSKIKGRCEELKFEIPCATLTATYLQVLCLAENIQTEFEDIVRLVEFNRGDVRRSILELQYWLLSGGDPRAVEDARSKMRLDVEENDDSAKKGGVLEEPDSTMSSLFDCPHDESSGDSFDEVATKTERSAAIHRGSFQQIHGLTVPGSIPLLASLQTADVKSLTLLMEQCHSLGVPLTLSNLPHLLCLPTCVKANDEQTKSSLDPRPGKDDEQFRKEVCGKTIAALSRLQDNLSWMDCNLNANECACTPSVGWWKWWYREPQPSEIDDACVVDVDSQLPRTREIYSSIGATSAWTCSQALQKVLRNVALHENQCLPYMTVPAGESFVSHDLEVNPKVCDKHLQCARFVENCLPSSSQTSRRNMVVDYFPFVRRICQAEKVRHATNTKRGGRFLHYLDSHSLPPHVLRQLSEEFPCITK